MEAQTLTFEGEGGACANSSREMAVLGERGRAREPGQRRMSARKNRRVICQTESSAKGTSGQMKAPTFGLHRGERPHSGFTPPDCVPHLFPRGVGPRFSFQRSASKRRACAGRFSAGIRSPGRSKAVVSLLAEVVAHGGFAVLLHGHGWRAWYRSRRIRSYYALHSSSKRTDLAASCVSMPGGDRDDGPSRTVVVLGHRSGCGSGCLQVDRHHSVCFRAVAWIERCAVTEQEHGHLAMGCSGKPLAAFASPAIPHMCVASTGNVFEYSPRLKGMVESDLGRCACAGSCLEAASRRSAGGYPTFFRRAKERLILFGDFSEGKTVTVPHVQRPKISFWIRRFRPAARAGRKDGIVADERSEDMASAATARRLGPFIRNQTTTMELDNLPIRCGCSEHRHRPKLFGGTTHNPNEPCPFDDYGVPVGAFGSCCALRGQATASELQSFGENLLAQGLHKDMSCAEAVLFARELRTAADRIEREYASDTTLEYEEQWDFEATLATIRTTARWYEKVANLGFGVFAWN